MELALEDWVEVGTKVKGVCLAPREDSWISWRLEVGLGLTVPASDGHLGRHTSGCEGV